MSELVRQMLDNIIDDKQAEAQENFKDLLAQKATDALDMRKIQIAQEMGANNNEIQAD